MADGENVIEVQSVVPVAPEAVVVVQPPKGFWDKVQDHLIDDWHRAFKFASVQISLLGVAAMGAAEVLGSSWGGLPPSLQDRIPHAQTIAMVLFVLNIGGRVYQKKGKTIG